MKLFFPDSHDYVDPDFDFVRERSSDDRERHRSDAYAHEILSEAPYDGLLISKSIVDGAGESSGKYTMAQRHRLLREGAHAFFRVDDGSRAGSEPFPIMGDCGAFAYLKADEPPITVDEAIDFYEECGLTHGQSVDHIVTDYKPVWDEPGLYDHGPPPRVQYRYDLTLRLAEGFWRRHQARSCEFVAVAVAQGWSPESYANAVVQLQLLGYDYIALGGLVPLRSVQIMEVLRAVMPLAAPTTRIHLLGVLRWECLDDWLDFGVASVDSTSPLRQAFLDAKKNYYVEGRSFETYCAIRVPQPDGNPRLKRRLLAGEVDCDQVRELERHCLERLREWDRGGKGDGLDDLCRNLKTYAGYMAGARTIIPSRRTLVDQPWKNCSCQVCREIGIEVILFRGANRNRRRGFHNLHVAYGWLQDAIRRHSERAPLARKAG